ncbi:MULTISPECIES: T9SS type A sorting domain-containing protein [Chitinophagaceae]
MPVLKAQTAMAPACDQPTGATGDIGGFNIPILGSNQVVNPGDATDGNFNTYAYFKAADFGVGVGTSYNLRVNLGSSNAGDVYVSMALLQGQLFTANAFSTITLTAYNNGSQVWSQSVGSSFASWGINIGSTGDGYISAPAGYGDKPYNQLVLSYTSIAAVSITGGIMNVYELRRVPFVPAVSISSSNGDACRKTSTLTANVTNLTSNNLTYAWYNGSSASGSVIATSKSLAGAVVGNTYTVVATIDAGCSFGPTVRSGQSTITVASVPPATVSVTVTDCNVLNATVTNATAASYSWSASNGGTIVSGASTSSATIGSNGTYTVTVTANGGCSIVSSGTVVNGLPTITPASGTILQGGTRNLSYTGNTISTSSGSFTAFNVAIPNTGLTFQTGTNSSKFTATTINATATANVSSIPVTVTAKNGNCATTANYTIPLAWALPVQYSSYLVAVQSNGVVNLSWTSATETNNKGYAVFGGTNLNNLKQIDFVSSKALNGTAGTGYAYTSQDKSPANNTLNYYQLRQVDLDGKINSGDIVSVYVTGAKEDVTIAPNPVDDHITISNVKPGSSIKIVSMSGQVMKVAIAQNSNVVINDLGILSSGVYVVMLVNTNGQAESRKIIKK